MRSNHGIKFVSHRAGDRCAKCHDGTYRSETPLQKTITVRERYCGHVFTCELPPLGCDNYMCFQSNVEFADRFPVAAACWLAENRSLQDPDVLAFILRVIGFNKPADLVKVFEIQEQAAACWLDPKLDVPESKPFKFFGGAIDRWTNVFLSRLAAHDRIHFHTAHIIRMMLLTEYLKASEGFDACRAHWQKPLPVDGEIDLTFYEPRPPGM